MSKKMDVTAPQLWIVLARAYGSIAAYVEREIFTQGLGLSDFMVLEVLLHKGPLTISAIGEKVLLASASMTSAIDRLEKHGWVVRRSCDSDRRIRLVELTAEGRKFISAMYAEHVKDLESVTVGLSAEERRVMYGGLKKIGLTAKAATPEKGKSA
jgi:MarR family transcriptional regulator, 2-MHQ and catechol-resistance regulon repressor